MNRNGKMVFRVLALFLALLLVIGTIVMPIVFADTDDEAAGDEEYEANYDEEYYGRFRGEDISISVYNWGEYLSDGSDDLMDICEEFKELTGITVYYTNFATNEELYAKIKGGNTVYDVIFPSDYMVARMIEEDMLVPLDHGNIPNMIYIDPQFSDPEYDPGSRYSVPYTWNTVAIIYNKELVDEEPTSWDILWDEKYKGQILMFSNSRDAFAIACKKLGYSMNTESEEELREAPYYAGDATLMMPYNENIAVAFPEEGTNLFIDAACIPKNSQHKEAAEMFINFLNEPNVAAENAEFIGYATPNLAAYALLDSEVQEDEAIYPPEYVIENSEQFIHLSEETNLLMDQLWTEVMAKGGSFVKWGLPPIAAILAIIIVKAVYKAKKRAAYRRMAEDL